MLIDARGIPHGQKLSADVCIIGAGAAGITLARSLIGRPLRVCLLESGGFQIDAATQALYQGVNTGVAYWGLDATRLRYFGGTTNHWGGWCRPPYAGDFAPRDWIPGSGWPFPRTALDPYYARAHAVLQLGPYEYDPAYFEQPPQAPRLASGSRRLRTTLVQFSPPTRFGQVYRDELVRAPNVELLLHANALVLDTPRTADRVSGVEAGTLAGNRFRIDAKHYVLAAGGIENARLLLLSNRAEAAGLGNRHDLVGRYFADHYTVDAAVLLPSDPKLPVGLYRHHIARGVYVKGYLSPTDPVLERHRMTQVHYALEPNFDRRYDAASRAPGVESLRRLTEEGARGRIPDDFADHLRNVLGDLDDIALSTYRKYWLKRFPVESYQVTIGVEPAPSRDSRVTLTDERDALGLNRVKLDWRLSPIDYHSFCQAQRILAEELGGAGLGRVKILDCPVSEFPFRKGGAISADFHHMGTTRMHADPRQGVVDADCRVHGVANLYVAGSSVFPVFGGQPTITIVALALRLADHLQVRLKSA